MAQTAQPQGFPSSRLYRDHRDAGAASRSGRCSLGLDPAAPPRPAPPLSSFIVATGWVAGPKREHLFGQDPPRREAMLRVLAGNASSNVRVAWRPVAPVVLNIKAGFGESATPREAVTVVRSDELCAQFLARAKHSSR